MLKINTEKLLQAEMDRKDFLRNTGIAVGVLTGAAAFVGKLNLLGSEQSSKANSLSYGGSSYGGSPSETSIPPYRGGRSHLVQ